MKSTAVLGLILLLPLVASAAENDQGAEKKVITRLETENQELRKQADAFQQDLKKAQGERDASHKKVVELTEKLNVAAVEQKRLAKMNRELVEQLGKARRVLTVGSHIAPSPEQQSVICDSITVMVSAVPRPDLVEITAGTDDGVRKGSQLEVIRKNAAGKWIYVGRIEVMDAVFDRAVCRADPKLLRSPIQRGDIISGAAKPSATLSSEKKPPAGLRTVVTAVLSPDRVEIGAGTDDGVHKGHCLEVVRKDGDKLIYVGRIEVVETFFDEAVCRTDPKLLRSPIQKGDLVYAGLDQRNAPASKK